MAPTSKELRYRQVYHYILELIQKEALEPGDKLPSSTELVRLTGVSMISVRRGLAELEQEGRIVRHQGVGTFVGRGKIVTDPTKSGGFLSSLSRNRMARPIRTELLSLTVGAVSANIARVLSLKVGEPAWEVRRLRHLGPAATIFDRAILPLSQVPALDERYLRDGNSLYDYLTREHSLVEESTEQTIEVDDASPEEAAALLLPAAEKVVRVRGITFSTSGAAFDCYEQVYRASAFVFYHASAGRHQYLQADSVGTWLIEPLGHLLPR